MKHKNSHLLVGYWSRLRNGRDVPDQTDIDPRAIKRMLSHVFILDAANPGRPIYRLAGTGLCERFGMELKGTGFLAHWEGQSGIALGSLLKQAQKTRQPVCLSAIGATADCGMVELETILAPITFNGGEPMRFLGLTQVLSDMALLAGRPIAFQRLVASALVREDEPLAAPVHLAPPPPPVQAMRNHPKAPHLRLVVNQDKPADVEVNSEEVLRRMAQLFNGNQ
ncbi:MAG: PAS domain-containing protein [Alphaproteobacteria bacterium]|nr:PAS domain-containing protein [Alphaproteobacteria bacterium]